MDEQALIDAYNFEKARMRDLENTCEKHFMPLAKEALDKEDIELAKQVMYRCPDHVVSVFIADAIRQKIKEAKFKPGDVIRVTKEDALFGERGDPLTITDYLWGCTGIWCGYKVTNKYGDLWLLDDKRYSTDISD